MADQTSAEPGEKAQKCRYDLFTLTDAAGLFLMLKDEGIIIEGDRLYWSNDEVETTASLKNLHEVRLQISQTKDGTVASCCLTFRNKARLTITSASKWGLPDEDRAPEYIRFVEHLHAVLAAQPDVTVRFAAGLTEGRHKFAFGAMVLGIAMFVVLPVVLLFITRDMDALWLAGGGVLFIYPAFRSMQRNAPQTYSPNHVPAELLP